jgi:hypothetical protein
VVKGLVDFVATRKGGPAEDAELGGGSLMATGLVAGGALTGVVVAILNVFAGDTMAKASVEAPLTAALGHGGYQLLGVALFLGLGVLLYRASQKKQPAL